MKYSKSKSVLRLLGMAWLGIIAMTSHNTYAAGSEKITICHFPPGNVENVQVISISVNAWDAHKRLHGAGDLADTIFNEDTGQCPLPVAATSGGCTINTAKGLMFTIDDPLIQESTAVADVLQTYDFESVRQWNKVFRAGTGETTIDWNGVGVYEGGDGVGQVGKPNIYGAAGGWGKYLFIKSTVGQSPAENPGVTLTFDEPVAYFGFWWSAGDHNNKLQVTLESGLVYDVKTNLVWDSDGFVQELASNDGHMGNPTSRFLDKNLGEPYAYLNLTSLDECSRIVAIRFHGLNFETDNHTVTTELITPPGTEIPMPEPLKPPIFGETGRFNIQEVNKIKVDVSGGGGGSITP